VRRISVKLENNSSSGLTSVPDLFKSSNNNSKFALYTGNIDNGQVIGLIDNIMSILHTTKRESYEYSRRNII
jgi:hypothetical protein